MLQSIKDQLKLQNHSFYAEKYHKKLKQPCCVIEPLTTLCGGWYLQTFKQVTNKLSKNKSSPLPLFFPNVDSMESISKNRNLLKHIFKAFDRRSLGKIDASELYTILLILSKGSYETYLKTVVEIFGFESTGRITRNEFFFFLDSFYRALPKVLIIKDYTDPLQVNARLQFKEINRFIDKIFDDRLDLQRNEIYQSMMKEPQLNDFLKYLHKRCIASAEHSRNDAIDRIKIQTDVRKCLADIISKVEKQLSFRDRILDQE